MRQRGRRHGAGRADLRLTAAFRTGHARAQCRDLTESSRDIQRLEDRLLRHIPLLRQRDEHRRQHAAAARRRRGDDALHARVALGDLERLLRHTLKIRPAEEAAALRRRAEPGRVAADEPAVGAVRCTVLPARLLHCRPERHNLAMGRRSVVAVFLTVRVADDGIERLPARLRRGKHRCNARKAHTGSSWLKIVIF